MITHFMHFEFSSQKVGLKRKIMFSFAESKSTTFKNVNF